jgi:hypothetical protein
MATRKEDKYDPQKAIGVAQSLYTRNQQEVMQMANEAAIGVLESSYRSGYVQALKDHGIEVYPTNITSRETVVIEE